MCESPHCRCEIFPTARPLSPGFIEQQNRSAWNQGSSSQCTIIRPDRTVWNQGSSLQSKITRQNRTAWNQCVFRFIWTPITEILEHHAGIHGFLSPKHEVIFLHVFLANKIHVCIYFPLFSIFFLIIFVQISRNQCSNNSVLLFKCFTLLFKCSALGVHFWLEYAGKALKAPP